MSVSAVLDDHVDDDVTFEFTVQNTSNQEIELMFRTGQHGEVTVYDAETDDLEWRWSEGRMFTQAIEHKTLAPGDELSMEFMWQAPPRGEYFVVAELTADVDVSANTSVTIGC